MNVEDISALRNGNCKVREAVETFFTCPPDTTSTKMQLLININLPVPLFPLCLRIDEPVAGYAISAISLLAFKSFRTNLGEVQQLVKVLELLRWDKDFER